MTWGAPEATRLSFSDEVETARKRVHAAQELIGDKSPFCIIRRERDPKRNWDTRIASWCVISPVRGSNSDHMFSLQWHRDVAGGPRVRAGCRYKTLPQAWKYIKQKRRSYYKNKYAQAENIIRLLLLKAQDADLPGVKGLKFDGSLSKR